MNIVQAAIRYPVSTAVGVILVLLFGGLSIYQIPIQLVPEFAEPQISINTIWPGASPREVEAEIVNKQEEMLKSVTGLKKLESTSTDGSAMINLTFQTGTNLDTALIRVSNRLEQVASYPDDVLKPVITTVGSSNSPIGWFIIKATEEDPYQGNIAELLHFIKEDVKPMLERVPGVGQINTFGGMEKEMQVVVDPGKLAARGITLNQMGLALQAENKNYSGGDFSEGKRRFVVRTVGEYQSPEDIENVVIAVVDNVPVYVRDVATVRLSYGKAAAHAFYKGRELVAINAVRETGANVLEVMEQINANMDDLNANLLNPKGLEIVSVHDETVYVRGAIDLVRQNLLVGGILAILVLLFFLRSGSSTLVIAAAIPICVIGTFLMMNLLGRTINVISLAGMAFAVGMVVDNAIVVLENIYRHYQMGKDRFDAALEGAREVWGAVLASTLTTVAVFIPVLFVEQEVGQLFRDIALAISCAVVISLIVSITVIPCLSARVLTTAKSNDTDGVGAFAKAVSGLVARINAGFLSRMLVIAGLTLAALAISVFMRPKADYLPTGNLNFIFGMVLPPPAYNSDQLAEFRHIYTNNLQELWSKEQNPELPGEGIKHFFYVTFNQQAFMGASTYHHMKVREILPNLQNAHFQVPGAFAFTVQMSIFQDAFDTGRAVDIEITGPDLERLTQLGATANALSNQAVSGSQVRTIPDMSQTTPELRVITHRQRAAELGVTNRDLGFAVSALVDGAKTEDYLYEGVEIDLKLMVDQHENHRSHLLEQMPIATPGGDLVALGSVADVQKSAGPPEINHIERRRSITVRVAPPLDMPLQDAMDAIQTGVLDAMITSGDLSGLYRGRLSGSADKLTQTFEALKWNFLLALVITYLLLAALFESFLYPLIILFSVPLAACGGILGLNMVNLISFQAMDVLTMLGFFILVGTVVNNAILIVHQALVYIREQGTEHQEAIRLATQTRIRPIFMSVCTSVLGMLPLVLFPGAGSELYRGLGSVVVGGLVVSTVFTLFLVPALLSLALHVRVNLLKSKSI